jgi:hypothetical protein
MEEYYCQCPYCWEEISVLIDLSVPHQSYIEDCEVCCNPIQFSVHCEEQNVTNFSAESIEQ